MLAIEPGLNRLTCGTTRISEKIMAASKGKRLRGWKWGGKKEKEKFG